MNLPHLLPLALLLPLACTPAPRFATHTCGGPTHVVQMPLTCIEGPDTLGGSPDHAGAIARTLAALAARTPGRAGETMTALAHDYERIDATLHADYAAACRAWSTPCDYAQEAAYAAARTELLGRNERLRSLHATVDGLASSGRRVELTDDAAKAALTELEATAEALRPP
jgi:hypothetical protein